MIDIQGIMSNLKVLYVEDEEITRMIMKKMLKKKCGKFYIGKDGQQGMELYHTHRPQLIITDLRMPNMNGMEMIKKIRKIDQECGIIIATEIEEKQYILDSVHIGIDQYLIKPIDEKMLIDAFDSVIRKIIGRMKEKEISHLLYTNKVEKQKLEDGIKLKISPFLKAKTGKGPKDIKVFIQGMQVNIKASGVLTVFEETLIQNEENITLVDYNRKVFYKSQRIEIEKLLEAILNMKVSLLDIYTNASLNVDELIFRLNIE
ncbi:Na-translocating system protein MpsC family protein [Crassaminicella profunda]|uniref:Na-translocating system protein MpsC family protein n=1 Tax=Crassaminicella profunda TaxID=1286698 RepID=UPI001CA6D2DD|nr:Na-translocating system protein MpsC family protein [Crassaminicella profunda]QZY55250.1 Na-translocating system protein MpsC family protein [Crassaminicella profunda]